MKNLTELELQIVHYNAQYRAGYPEISDSTYDSLIERLKKEQPESVLLKRAIIEKAKESRKTKLPFPMMSLEKVKTLDGVISWIKESGETEVVITPKFDGITLLQTPNRFYTRGDGKVGQDCTKHCSFIPSLPFFLKGELIILNENWEKNSIFKKYKHPRNTVAGWVNGDYSEEIPYNLMTYMVYDSPCAHIDKSLLLDQLRESSLNVSPFLCLKVEDLSEERLDKLFYLWKKFYPMDGLVIEFNHYQLRSGEYPNGNPKYAIAYKPSRYSEIAETTITDIEMSINRFGVVTPTILFNSVNLSNAEISRVNGINMSYVYDWGLFPGEKIEIIRSGEVIPKIISVGGVKIPFQEDFNLVKEYNKAYEEAKAERELSFGFIEKTEDFADNFLCCQFCGSSLTWDGLNQICPNEMCSERNFQKIVDFFKIFEVENIAEGTLKILWDKGYDSVKKVLGITKEELLEIEGFAEKSSNDFIQTIKKLKREGGSLARHMHASGLFPNLGEKTLQLILDNWSAGTILDKENLVKINGIGDKITDIFIQGIRNFEQEIGYGIKITYRDTPRKEKINGVYSGSVFCFTGCRPNPELREKLESQGAEVSENMTSKVTHLVTKDLSSTSSKIERARKSGVKILSLEGLR